MIFDFDKFSKDIASLQTQDDFSAYLESCFIELEEYLLNISDDEIQKIKFDIEDMLYNLLDNNLILNHNSKTINAFLILLAEKFLQTSLIGAITIIADYLPNGATKLRLEAAKLYLRVNDISKDYFSRYDAILGLLDNSVKVDEYNTKAIKTFLYFCQLAIAQFQRVGNEELFSFFVKMLLEKKAEHGFLQDILLKNFYEQIIKTNPEDSYLLTTNILNSISHKKPLCILEPSIVSKENSPYSQKLYSLVNPTFDEIKSIAYKYIQSIGDKQELYDRLIRGEAIIDDEVLLYKYLASFGSKHKAKLYSAYDAIIDKLRYEKFNIVDWACGQGMATIVLLNYAKERNIELNIENITLIEPSSLALSRALLHVDVLKQKEYNICAINSDFDCLDADMLDCSNGLETLHLFSNILDVENFSLDTNFFKKVSQGSNTASIFVCVSPNRNDKLNNRLDLFFNYFDENFDTELIASRDTDINGTTRYEKIFEVKQISEEVVQEKRDEIQIVQKSYQLDILYALNNYSNYVVPILNMKILEDSINSDPEYAIFKIRKVAEVITSKIYSQYEKNERTISFNDKIRYLSYEKKVFDKTITNYVQTIRTIGNRGVHEEDRDTGKQKLDAHLMVIALVSFLNELTDKKLLK